MNDVTTKAKFKLGVTLYSFAAEWAAGEYNLDSMLKRVVFGKVMTIIILAVITRMSV